MDQHGSRAGPQQQTDRVDGRVGGKLDVLGEAGQAGEHHQ